MLKFPVTLKNIKRFEDANDVSVNVYTVATKDEDDADDETADADDDDAAVDAAAVDDDDIDDDILLYDLLDDDNDVGNSNIVDIDDDDDDLAGYFDEEAGCDDVGDDGDIDDADLAGLIDDDSMILDDENFYRAVDNDREPDVVLDVPVAPTVDPPFTTVKEKPGVIVPLRISDDIREVRDGEGEIIENRHVNLLLTERDGDTHYSTITNFSGLVKSQVSKRTNRMFFVTVACIVL